MSWTPPPFDPDWKVSMVPFPEPKENGYRVIVLDPIVPGQPEPDYCLHGRASCANPGCGEWVWLGDKSHEEVLSGRALPICLPCAQKWDPDEVAPKHEGTIIDNRRANGPHA